MRVRCPSRFVVVAAAPGLLLPLLLAAVDRLQSSINPWLDFGTGLLLAIIVWPAAIPMFRMQTSGAAMFFFSLFANAVLYAAIACTLRALWRRLRG